MTESVLFSLVLNIQQSLLDTLNVGIQVSNSGGMIYYRTDLSTFNFLAEQPCLFGSTETEATIIMLHISPFTVRYILKPWVSCALSKGCLTFDGSLNKLNCGVNGPHMCHRFDQSALGIILTRLFSDKKQLVYFKNHIYNIRRARTSRYIDKKNPIYGKLCVT